MHGGKIRRSVVSRDVSIGEGAELDECIICDNTKIGAGAKLTRVIVDRWNEIAPGEVINAKTAWDRKGYVVDPSGIVVVARGKTRALQ